MTAGAILFGVTNSYRAYILLKPTSVCGIDVVREGGGGGVNVFECLVVGRCCPLFLKADWNICISHICEHVCSSAWTCRRVSSTYMLIITITPFLPKGRPWTNGKTVFSLRFVLHHELYHQIVTLTKRTLCLLVHNLEVSCELLVFANVTSSSLAVQYF